MPQMDIGNYLVWQAIKMYLPPGTKLNSVYRPPTTQLKFIVDTARRRGYHFASPPVLGDRSSWSGALDYIRSKGYKVAEPGKSMHQRGLAYDFIGPDLEKIRSAI